MQSGAQGWRGQTRLSQCGPATYLSVLRATGPNVQKLSQNPSSSTIKAATTATICPIDFLALRGCLFDLDGTCADTEPLHFRVYQETLKEVGYNGGRPIDMAFFRARISGRHNPLITADLFPERPEAWRQAWCEDREGRFRALAASHLQPVRGLSKFVAWVQARGLRRAVVTNAPRSNAEVMVQGLGLGSFFEHLVIGDECDRGKPYPDPYKAALVRIGLRHAHQQVLVLEDSPSGVQAGAAAGLRVVGMTCGGQPEQVLLSAGATLCVRDFEELVELVEAQEALMH